MCARFPLRRFEVWSASPHHENLHAELFRLQSPFPRAQPAAQTEQETEADRDKYHLADEVDSRATSWVSTAEEWALANPFWYVPLIAALAAIWLAVGRYRGELTFIDKRLIFKEQPDAAVEKLDLTFSR